MPTITRLPRGRRPTGPIMAERRFELTGQPSQRASIRVRRPIKDPRTGNYKCSVEWIHSGERELFELWGIDSMQALHLAIRAAGNLVNRCEEKFKWVGSAGGYLGFPGTYPEGWPKPLLRKLERLIDRKIAANTRQLIAKRPQFERQQRLNRPTTTRLPRGRRPTGPIIAERRFELMAHPPQRASIRVRRPVKDPRTGDYRCSVEWIHSGERELFELRGIDSMQALQLARREAGNLVNRYKKKLRWAGGDDGDLGFPRSYPEGMPRALLRKLERMIDREIAANTRQLIARRQRRERQQRLKPAARGRRPAAGSHSKP